jgi:hypothetical protein
MCTVRKGEEREGVGYFWVGEYFSLGELDARTDEVVEVY